MSRKLIALGAGMLLLAGCSTLSSITGLLKSDKEKAVVPSKLTAIAEPIARPTLTAQSAPAPVQNVAAQPAEKAPAAQPSLAAAKLAEALFRGFPGESGRTITVP